MNPFIIKEQSFSKYGLALDSRGFLWIKHQSHVTFELEDAEQQEKEIHNFCNGQTMPFLIDVRVTNWNAPKEVREFHSTSPGILKLKNCEALLVNNVGMKLLANFYSKFNHQSVPVKVFTDESEAIDWLMGINEQT